MINPATVPVYEYNLTDHLGNVRVLLAEDGTVKQSTDYYPFGLTMRQSRVPSPDNRYLFNGVEEQDLTRLYLMDYRLYDPEIGRFTNIDPIVKHHESLYAWVTNNPISFHDPLGADSTQRANAVNKAQEYLDEKPEGNSYGMGKKEQPGGKVDCSGMVSNCVKAGGESNPNVAVEGGQRKADGTQSGVLNIEDNTNKIDNENVQEGNIITFHKNTGYPYHTGLVSSVTINEDGSISITFIHSKGGTGPTSDSFTTGDGSNWANWLHGFYKWDTKPDVVNAPRVVKATTSPKSSGVARTPSGKNSMFNRLKNSYNNFTNEMQRGANEFKNRIYNLGIN